MLKAAVSKHAPAGPAWLRVTSGIRSPNKQSRTWLDFYR
jgi:hypothetical protein